MKRTISSKTQTSEANIQAIVACSRLEMSESELADIRLWLAGVENWPELIELANRNGVLPLIARNIARHFSDHVPSEVFQALKSFLRTHTLRNLVMTNRLIGVCNLLQDKGIKVVSFKGPVLAQLAYGNLLFRQFCDLDLLVRPSQFDEAVRIMTEGGYNLVETTGRLKRLWLAFTHKKDVTLYCPNDEIPIELHWKLSGTHFSLPVRVEELERRLESVQIGGKALESLGFNDLFLYLCLHGARHEWERLSWISDLAHLIRARELSGQPVDLNQMLDFARQNGCERILELGLHLVDRFYKASAYQLELSEVDDELRGLGDEIERRIFSVVYEPSPKKVKYQYLLSLQATSLQRYKLYVVYMSYYLSVMLTPNSADRDVLRLPAILYPLYYVLRPFRLVLKMFGVRQGPRERAIDEDF